MRLHIDKAETEFAKRVRIALNYKGISQSEAAKRLTKKLGREVKPQTVQYLAQKAESSPLTADLAMICGVSYEWLAHGPTYGEGTPAEGTHAPDDDNVADTTPHENGTLARHRRLYLKGTAQMGPDGFWYDLEYPQVGGDGYVDVPTDDPAAYCLRVRGDSMFPAIRDNWIVAVEPNAPIVPGEYVHVKTKDGRYMVKELLWHRNGEYVLHSVNQSHGRLTLKDQDVEYAYFCWPVPPSKWRP